MNEREERGYSEQMEEGYEHCALGGPSDPQFLRTVYEKIAEGWQLDDIRAVRAGGRSGLLDIHIWLRRKPQTPAI